MVNVVGIFYGFKFVGEDLIRETLTDFLRVLKSKNLGKVLDEEVFMVSPDLVDIEWNLEIFPDSVDVGGVARVVLSVLEGTSDPCLIMFVEPLHFVNFGGSFNPVGFPGKGSDGWGVMELFSIIFGLGAPEWFVYGESQ